MQFVMSQNLVFKTIFFSKNVLFKAFMLFFGQFGFPNSCSSESELQKHYLTHILSSEVQSLNVLSGRFLLKIWTHSTQTVRGCFLVTSCEHGLTNCKLQCWTDDPWAKIAPLTTCYDVAQWFAGGRSLKQLLVKRYQNLFSLSLSLFLEIVFR